MKLVDGTMMKMLRQLFQIFKYIIEDIISDYKMNRYLKNNPDKKVIWSHQNWWEGDDHRTHNEMISYNEYKQRMKDRK